MSEVFMLLAKYYNMLKQRDDARKWARKIYKLYMAEMDDRDEWENTWRERNDRFQESAEKAEEKAAYWYKKYCDLHLTAIVSAAVDGYWKARAEKAEAELKKLRESEK